MSYKSLLVAAMFVGLGCTPPAAPKKEQPQAQPVKQTTVAEPKSEPKPEPKPEEKPAATVSPVNTAKVTLLEAGTAPLNALRLQPKKGDKLSAEMTMEIEMSMTVNGMTPPTPKTPAIVMGLDIEVADVTAENDIRYNFVFNKISVQATPDTSPQMVEAIQTNLKTMEGLSGFSVVDNRGFTKQAEFKTPDAVAPQLKQTLDSMKQSLNQMSAPLPEEPVGVGAKWKVEQSLVSNGMNIQQSTTYTLKAIDGNKLTFGVELSQSAPEQDIVPPNMPTAKIKLTSLESKGAGDLEMSLDKVMPSKGSLVLSSDFQMSATDKGTTQDLAMKMNMKMGIESK